MIDFEEHFFDSNRVIISFAGGPQNQFQFRSILGKTKFSFVLLRDTTQTYFLSGILGIGDQVDVLHYIKKFIKNQFHVTTIGVSSGAYAALLYGQLAPVNEIIVFSALTGRDGCDDFEEKWQSQIIDPNTRCPDLRPFFRDGPIPRVRAFISDGYGCEIDRQMVERIGIKEITLVPGFSHGELARGMRDKGMMKDLFS